MGAAKFLWPIQAIYLSQGQFFVIPLIDIETPKLLLYLFVCRIPISCKITGTPKDNYILFGTNRFVPVTYIETIWSYIPYIVIFWCSCDIRTGHLLTGTFPVNKFFMTRTILINNSILTLYEMFFWESKRNLFHSAHVKCVFELVKLSQVDVWEKVCISKFNFTHIATISHMFSKICLCLRGLPHTKFMFQSI